VTLPGILYHPPRMSGIPPAYMLNAFGLDSGQLMHRRRKKEERRRRVHGLLQFGSNAPVVPKQNRTAYNYFFGEWRMKLKAELPDVPDKDISKMIGQQWMALSPEQRLVSHATTPFCSFFILHPSCVSLALFPCALLCLHFLTHAVSVVFPCALQPYQALAEQDRLRYVSEMRDYHLQVERLKVAQEAAAAPILGQGALRREPPSRGHIQARGGPRGAGWCSRGCCSEPRGGGHGGRGGRGGRGGGGRGGGG